ncbi:acyl-CoA dehydrogenase family protein [Amycolatopsis lurida]
MTDPLQLLDIPATLPADERDIQATVARFAEDRLRPGIREWYESGRFPRELAPEFGKLGVLGMHLDGYGCAGASALAYGLACLELEAADSGFRSFVSVQGSLAMFSIHRYGSAEQKAEWLPRLAAGEAIGCFGLTEPDFGSDPGGMRTRAVRDGGDWVLDGTKMWITNGSIADVATVWARTDEGIRGFVVPTDTPGFSARAVGHKLSLRASITAELVLDGVRLPGSAMLPEARGLSAPLSCLNEARFGIVFGAVGAARDSIMCALDYAKNRTQFGKPIAGFQLTQRKLADMTVSAGNAMLLALHLARLKDQGTIRGEQISAGKLNNVREAIAIARECRTILGGSGITTEYSRLRHASNLESVLTYEGTSEVHTLVIGQALTGIAAYR